MSANVGVLGYDRAVGSRITILLISFAAALLPACGSSTPAASDGSTCANPGATAYLKTCVMNTDCASCLCQNFGHTTVCTKSCTGDADCPAPSGGCTNNVCRP